MIAGRGFSVVIAGRGSSLGEVSSKLENMTPDEPPQPVADVSNKMIRHNRCEGTYRLLFCIDFCNVLTRDRTEYSVFSPGAEFAPLSREIPGHNSRN